MESFFKKKKPQLYGQIMGKKKEKCIQLDDLVMQLVANSNSPKIHNALKFEGSPM